MSCFKNKQFTNECRYCGNTTVLNVVAEHTEDSQLDYFCWTKRWILLKCPVCQEISVATIYAGDDTVYADRNMHEEFSIVYPSTFKESPNVPQHIKEAFKSALQVFYKNPTICVLALRRTLEFICEHQGAAKSNLKDNIQHLETKGILPNTLKSTSDLIRDLGNKSAHDYDTAISKDTAKKLIHLTQKIIEYIYILPYEIEEISNN